MFNFSPAHSANSEIIRVPCVCRMAVTGASDNRVYFITKQAHDQGRSDQIFLYFYVVTGIGICNFRQYQCLNGKCISGGSVCDGSNDCGDNSDETKCGSSKFEVLFCALAQQKF